MPKPTAPPVPERLRAFVAGIPDREMILREAERCRAELAFLRRLEQLRALAEASTSQEVCHG